MNLLKLPAVRWVLVLPTALLASMVIIFLIRLVNGIWAGSDPNKLTVFGAFGEAFVNGMGCGALIFVAAWMAPKGKLIVAVVLATLLGLTYIIGLVYSAFHSQYLMFIVFIGGLIGVWVGVYGVNENPPDFDF